MAHILVYVLVCDVFISKCVTHQTSCCCVFSHENGLLPEAIDTYWLPMMKILWTYVLCVAGKWQKCGPERLAAAWKAFQRIISLIISTKLFTKIDEHHPLDSREGHKEAEKERVSRVRRDKIEDSSTRQFLTAILVLPLQWTYRASHLKLLHTIPTSGIWHCLISGYLKLSKTSQRISFHTWRRNSLEHSLKTSTPTGSKKKFQHRRRCIERGRHCVKNDVWNKVHILGNIFLCFFCFIWIPCLDVNIQIWRYYFSNTTQTKKQHSTMTNHQR